MGSHGEEDEEITLYLKVTETVEVKVKKSAKVKDLKSLFHKKAGVSENLQLIFHNGKHLRDEKKLVDYNIRSESNLNLYVRTRGDSSKLFVYIPVDDRTIDHRALELEPTEHDTIKNIKYLIWTKEGIETESYDLFYNGKQLEDSMTLASLHMSEESGLYLVFNPKDSLPVLIELPSKKVLEVEVKYVHRIRDLKAIILSMGHLGDVFYEGKQLDDDLKTVASYDIKPNSTLRVLPIKFQVFVRNWDGKTSTFYVKPKDTILDVKKQILSKLGLRASVYWLQYCGKRLEEDQDLASYNIQKNATMFIHYHNDAWIDISELNEIIKENRKVAEFGKGSQEGCKV